MKTFLVILFVAFSSLLLAQLENPFGQIYHSSADASGQMHLRWDDYTAGMGLTQCLYSVNDGTWANSEISTPNPGSMETLVPYSFGSKLRYRLHYSTEYMNESLAMLHAAYWDADTFPPAVNKMALIGTDPTGDSLTVYSPNLDLTDSYMATTPQKLYITLKNHSGSYPTFNSITSYNIYLGTIANVEAATDSVAFAMIYSFNIPGVLSSGLYKIGFDDITQMPVFTRLGNIQSQVSGGALHLACNFSDLTADPNFGTWPNASQSLSLVGMTMAIDIDLQTMKPVIGLGDNSTPAIVMFQDNYYQVAQNTLPVCTEPSYSHSSRTFFVQYLDENLDYPLMAYVSSSSTGNLPLISMYNEAPFNTGYYADFPANYNNEPITYYFSDNGMDIVSGSITPTSVEDDNLVLRPLQIEMPNPLYPNSGVAHITIKGLSDAPLKVMVYNLKGQKVAELFSGQATSGEQIISWNKTKQGSSMASGIYLLRLENGQRSITKKFIMAK